MKNLSVLRQRMKEKKETERVEKMEGNGKNNE